MMPLWAAFKGDAMNTSLSHRDLGELHGPVLIFGGSYSNLQATEALLAEAQRRAIAPGNLICSGDVVAYCADGPATVAAIRISGCVVVAGNCERQLAAGAQDCGCGFEDGSACDLLSMGWFGQANRAIGADDRAWMGTCPDIATFRQTGRRYAVIHGGISDISRFLWPVSGQLEFMEEIAQVEASVGPVDMVIAGHCGVAFQRQIGSVSWLNAGAIGLPPHDGRPQTRFAVLDQGRAIIHRLKYDHIAARAAMDAAGLVQGYHETLGTGIWPSEDVLPVALRRS